MQKALILALLIGAFLLPSYVTAQDAQCPGGGTYYEGHGCGIPFEEGTEIKWKGSCYDNNSNFTVIFADSFNELIQLCHDSNSSNTVPGACSTLNHRIQNAATVADIYHLDVEGSCSRHVGTAIVGQLQSPSQVPVEKSCPEDFPNGPVDVDGTKICISEDLPQDCPTEPGPNPIFYIGQQGGGTACIEEDNGSICPYVEDPNLPGYYTADFSNPQSCAGEEPEEPDLKPDCTEGGNGMTVCKADPDDKCTVNSTGLLSCEANCGYINGQFYCPEEPDVPETPDPEISDDIQDPNKPMGDMVKQDFKDVLVGAETRLSSIKKELEDVQLSNDKNTDKLSDKLTGLGAKVDQVNRNLVGIQGTLDDTLYGEQLEIDSSGFQDEINQGLGLTGDETLEDLEGEPISLDDFSGNFQFSLGSSACPADRQINVLGQAHSISWQPFCDVFSFIGVLVQISAYVLSLFIVFGGRK